MKNKFLLLFSFLFTALTSYSQNSIELESETVIYDRYTDIQLIKVNSNHTLLVEKASQKVSLIDIDLNIIWSKKIRNRPDSWTELIEILIDDESVAIIYSANKTKAKNEPKSKLFSWRINLLDGKGQGETILFEGSNTFSEYKVSQNRRALLVFGNRLHEKEKDKKYYDNITQIDVFNSTSLTQRLEFPQYLSSSALNSFYINDNGMITLIQINGSELQVINSTNNGFQLISKSTFDNQQYDRKAHYAFMKNDKMVIYSLNTNKKSDVLDIFCKVVNLTNGKVLNYNRIEYNKLNTSNLFGNTDASCLKTVIKHQKDVGLYDVYDCDFDANGNLITLLTDNHHLISSSTGHTTNYSAHSIICLSMNPKGIQNWVCVIPRYINESHLTHFIKHEIKGEVKRVLYTNQENKNNNVNVYTEIDLKGGSMNNCEMYEDIPKAEFKTPAFEFAGENNLLFMGVKKPNFVVESVSVDSGY